MLLNLNLKTLRSCITMKEQDVDGVTHVLVPKEVWEKMWELIDNLTGE